MRPVPPFNPWVTRLLFFIGGYALRWWASGTGSSTEEDALPRRRCPRRRAPLPAEELKLVLVVNEALKMGKGKIGAQCAHAAVGIVTERHIDTSPVLLAQWEECGQPKVCLRAQDDTELQALAASAAALGLPIYMVQDAGRTQVAAGSRTVLAIGPAGRSQVDKVTGSLKLL